MKTTHKIILLISIIIFAISCKKDTDDTKQTATSNSTYTKNLKLDNNKRAYYNSDNNRYETNYISSDTSSFNYSINVEPGKKYRILIYGFYMKNVDLDLFDKSDVLIKSGAQANVGNTAKYMVYESSINDTLFINIKSDSTFNNAFFLSFEEVNTYEIYWKNHSWSCDGDWEVNSQDQLIFKSYHSGFTKWIKLNDSTLHNYTCDISFDANNGTLNNFLGLAVRSSDIIHDMTNLPEVSKQFKLNNHNIWELWHINIGTGGGIGRETGYLANYFNTTNNIITSNIHNDSLSFSVNNELAIKAFASPIGHDLFYITSEDFGNDSVVITDIRFY